MKVAMKFAARAVMVVELSLLPALWMLSLRATADQGIPGAPLAPSPSQVAVGRIVRMSKLPNPATSEYVNCFYATMFEVLGMASGKPVPGEINLTFPGFKKRILLPESKFAEGDWIKVKLVPFDSLPEAVKSTQQANDIEDFDLEVFFAESSERLAAPPPEAALAAPRAEKRPAAAPATVLPIDEYAAAEREKAMKKDMVAIDALLQAHRGDWTKWHAELEPFRKEYPKSYQGKWLGDSYFSTGTPEVFESVFTNGNAIEALVSMDRYFRRRNIDFMVVIVPPREFLTADIFTYSLPADKMPNPSYWEFARTLLEHGVEVVDPWPIAMRNRFKHHLMYFYNSPTEHHPAEGVMWSVAQALAERMARYRFDAKGGEKRFALESVPWDDNNANRRGVWPKGHAAFPVDTPISFIRVVNPQDNQPVVPAELSSSPILLTGDSFMFYPALWRGGSYPNYLAYYLGVVPDVLYRDGSSPGMARFIQQKGPEFLANRKCCVLLFPLRYSGVKWAKAVEFDNASYAQSKPLAELATAEQFKACVAPADNPGMVIDHNGVTVTPASRPLTVNVPDLPVVKAGKLFVALTMKSDIPPSAGVEVMVGDDKQYARIRKPSELFQFDIQPGNADVVLKFDEETRGLMTITKLVISHY